MIFLLFQQKPDDTIEIDLGLDVTSAELKVTYLGNQGLCAKRIGVYLRHMESYFGSFYL